MKENKNGYPITFEIHTRYVKTPVNFVIAPVSKPMNKDEFNSVAESLNLVAATAVGLTTYAVLEKSNELRDEKDKDPITLVIVGLN